MTIHQTSMRFDTNENERLRIDNQGHITSSFKSSGQSNPTDRITNVTGDVSTYYSDQGNGGSGITTYNDVFEKRRYVKWNIYCACNW